MDAESGNITIKKTSDNSTIEAIDVTSGQVTGGGTTTITVNPSVTLDDATSYYVQIDATAFDDTAGNSFAGIATTTTWSFTTADETAPTLQTLSPADNATDVSTTANLVLTFDESIGTSGTGTVRIYRSSDDVLIEQIAVTGSLVTGSGTTQITINPDTTFTAGTAYYIHISADAFPDAAGNFFVGISDGTTWNFVIAESVVRQSESASTAISQASGGRRGSLAGMQRRIMQAFQAMHHGRRSAAPAEQENAVSTFQVRVCARVHRRAFAEHVLERVNTRLLLLFGFTCAP